MAQTPSECAHCSQGQLSLLGFVRESLHWHGQRMGISQLQSLPGLSGTGYGTNTVGYIATWGQLWHVGPSVRLFYYMFFGASSLMKIHCAWGAGQRSAGWRRWMTSITGSLMLMSCGSTRSSPR